CINASGVWVPRHAEVIAEALADRLKQIVPRAAEDEAARLAPFVDGNVARRITQLIDQGLDEAGAREVTLRENGRLVNWSDCTYLLPTIVLCATPEHPLANREYLFPFASVVQARQQEIPEALGPSLVVTAITNDKKLIERLVGSATVDRLNIGAVPTNQVNWD